MKEVPPNSNYYTADVERNEKPKDPKDIVNDALTDYHDQIKEEGWKSLSKDDIRATEKEIKMKFSDKNLIPVLDTNDDSYIVYNTQNKSWFMFILKDKRAIKQNDDLGDFFEYALEAVIEPGEDENDDGEVDNKPVKPQKVQKPDKPNVFRRIQNKALDANVKFNRKVANGQRTAVDAKNAARASAKIPLNISDAIKKDLQKWEEANDDKHKEYIVKPGYRKKYFKAFKIAIMHYLAYAINPLLNIVLFMAQKMSASKDVRLRNELIRELDTEIKVVTEKIEDAKAAGDQNQKYKLMRIKEKLEAEKARVGLNSRVI